MIALPTFFFLDSHKCAFGALTQDSYNERLFIYETIDAYHMTIEM